MTINRIDEVRELGAGAINRARTGEDCAAVDEAADTAPSSDFGIAMA